MNQNNLQTRAVIVLVFKQIIGSEESKLDYMGLQTDQGLVCFAYTFITVLAVPGQILVFDQNAFMYYITLNEIEH